MDMYTSIIFLIPHKFFKTPKTTKQSNMNRTKPTICPYCGQKKVNMVSHLRQSVECAADAVRAMERIGPNVIGATLILPANVSLSINNPTNTSSAPYNNTIQSVAKWPSNNNESEDVIANPDFSDSNNSFSKDDEDGITYHENIGNEELSIATFGHGNAPGENVIPKQLLKLLSEKGIIDEYVLNTFDEDFANLEMNHLMGNTSIIAVHHDDHIASVMENMQEDDDSLNSECLYIPVNDNMYHRIFTAEEQLMTRMCYLFDRANVPLSLVNDTMDILRTMNEQNLTYDIGKIRLRKQYLKNLEKKNFRAPQSSVFEIGLEGSFPMDHDYTREYRDIVSVSSYNFLEQAQDLVSDIHLWGDMRNFVGTTNVNDPFCAITPRMDGLVDEVVDGEWYRNTYSLCHDITNNNKFLILGVIIYCDKTGTDVNQRNGLEPLSFTFTIFNRKC
jgi:hypothetical protein